MSSQRQVEKKGRAEAPAQRPVGRRARERAAQAQAARRRILIMWLGSASVIVVILIVAIAVYRNQSPSGAALTDQNAYNPPNNMLKKGATAPNFDLATIDGQHYRLSDQRGHPVLLEFFAVWCPHCQAEAPLLNQLDKHFASKGLRTFSILASPYGKDYDTSGGTDTRLADKSDLTWFKNTYSVAHPILIDPKFATVNKYGFPGYPGIYILNGAGKVTYTDSGEVSYQTLADAVAAAMKG